MLSLLLLVEEELPPYHPPAPGRRSSLASLLLHPPAGMPVACAHIAALAAPLAAVCVSFSPPPALRRSPASHPPTQGTNCSLRLRRLVDVVLEVRHERRRPLGDERLRWRSSHGGANSAHKRRAARSEIRFHPFCNPGGARVCYGCVVGVFVGARHEVEVDELHHHPEAQGHPADVAPAEGHKQLLTSTSSQNRNTAGRRTVLC